MQFIDSHSHLNSDAFDEDRDEVIARMKAAGMAAAMVIACEDDELPKLEALLAEHPGWLFGAWALHPEFPDKPEPTVERIAEICSRPGFAAVGETGLDFYWCKEPLDWQRARFRRHIEAAKAIGKPLIIHARDSEREALEILRDMHAGDVGFVMHCFCGDTDMALAVVDAGGHVSFTGNLTFQAANERCCARPRGRFRSKASCSRPTVPTWRPCPCAAGDASRSTSNMSQNVSQDFSASTKRTSPDKLRPTPSGSSACPSVLRKHEPFHEKARRSSCRRPASALRAPRIVRRRVVRRLRGRLRPLRGRGRSDGPQHARLQSGDRRRQRRRRQAPSLHGHHAQHRAGKRRHATLTWALRSESWDLARVLLDAQGIDVNMENRHGETPLMLAVIKGREAEFDRLLKLGAKVNKTRGWTPLHYAATEGRTSMMKRLIELGADVNAQTKAGITALDMAARKPSREAVMMLLRAGAYRDYCTDRGMSAADFAKKAGDEELAKYLAVKTCAVTGPARPELYRQPAGITLRH